MEVNNKTAPVTGQQDQNAISLDLMNRMKLHGMAEAFRESLAGTTPQSMTADTFLSMLLAREWDYRAQAAIARLTKNAAFRYKAYVEQIDYATNRGLDRNQMERLATLDFVHKAQNLFITGSSGTGKSFLACALGHEACKRGLRTFYANAPKLLGALKVAKVKGTLETELKKIERCQLLILDDLFSDAGYSSLTTCSSCLSTPRSVPYCLTSSRTGMNENPSSSHRSTRPPTGTTW